ncbi:MAG: ABC transporter ATP-binding protein, partial [Micromonosporaceae bacterium]
GESGSGKTMTALAVMGLLPGPAAMVSRGTITFQGREIQSLPERGYRRLRGSQMSMIFQDPMSSLNPVHTVGRQIAEMFFRHKRLGRRSARNAAVRLMERVRIPDAAQRAKQHPHQFSGGMRQRVMIAMALALDPALLIADEPTTALDVTVQSQILGLLRDIQQAERTAVLFISHDLGVVASIASQVAVMYAGRVVESGPVQQVYDAPAHPYTRSLLRSAPVLDGSQTELEAIGGAPPTVTSVPSGCPFHPRCPMARDLCRTTMPERRTIRPGQQAACHYSEELAGVT